MIGRSNASRDLVPMIPLVAYGCFSPLPTTSIPAAGVGPLQQYEKYRNSPAKSAHMRLMRPF